MRTYLLFLLSVISCCLLDYTTCSSSSSSSDLVEDEYYLLETKPQKGQTYEKPTPSLRKSILLSSSESKKFSVLDFEQTTSQQAKHAHDLSSTNSGSLNNRQNSPNNDVSDILKSSEDELADKSSFWGRLYVEGFGFPMQFFRAHFGLPPTKGMVQIKLADPIDMCRDSFQQDTLEPDIKKDVKLFETTAKEGDTHVSTILLAIRGSCSFTEKAELAHEKYGAQGILYINNQDGIIHPSGILSNGDNNQNQTLISAAMISKNDGLLLKDALHHTLDKNYLKARFVPIRCNNENRNKANGDYCQPMRKHDLEFVKSIEYKGLLNVFNSRNDKKFLLLSTLYVQAKFGSRIVDSSENENNDRWILKRADTTTSACEPIPMDTYKNRSKSHRIYTAVLVKRGLCSFSQKAENLANGGADLMILSNSNHDANNDDTRIEGMGYESLPKQKYMPGIMAIMISNEAGKHLNDLFEKSESVGDALTITLDHKDMFQDDLEKTKTYLRFFVEYMRGFFLV